MPMIIASCKPPQQLPPAAEHHPPFSPAPPPGPLLLPPRLLQAGAAGRQVQALQRLPRRSVLLGGLRQGLLAAAQAGLPAVGGGGVLGPAVERSAAGEQPNCRSCGARAEAIRGATGPQRHGF